MEKRSRRRIRDLVALAAFQGLSENEIGCARISMMARSKRAPFKGRIQKRKTNRLQIVISGLHRTAGPYKVPQAVIGRVEKAMDRADYQSKPVRAFATEFCLDTQSDSQEVPPDISSRCSGIVALYRQYW